MSDRRPRFHLAVPVHDLAAASAFYGDVLGLKPSRSNDSLIDWDLSGHQFVTHLVAGQGTDQSKLVDGRNVPVPHFGLILSADEFHTLADRLRENGTAFEVEPYLRYPGKVDEQWTMFFRDPSGNAMEFKAFADEERMFGQ
jgi:extradiol dioxygenase family protein